MNGGGGEGHNSASKKDAKKTLEIPSSGQETKLEVTILVEKIK